MSLYVSLSDFKGQTNTAKDIFTKSDMQEYLDKFEVQYLQELLGADLYAAFKVDFAILGNVPTDPKFVEIWNSFTIDHSAHLHKSVGIKAMLVGFIYWEYLRDQPIKNNIGGNQRSEQANSTPVDSQGTNVYSLYNDMVVTFDNIQWLIIENPNNYDWDLFNGQEIEYISMI